MEENTDTRGGIRIHRHVCRHPESMLYPPFRLFFWGSSGTGYDALSGRGIKASRTAAPGCLLFRASVWRGGKNRYLCTPLPLAPYPCAQPAARGHHPAKLAAGSTSSPPFLPPAVLAGRRRAAVSFQVRSNFYKHAPQGSHHFAPITLRESERFRPGRPAR